MMSEVKISLVLRVVHIIMFNTSAKSSDLCLSNDVWYELTQFYFKKKLF